MWGLYCALFHNIRLIKMISLWSGQKLKRFPCRHGTVSDLNAVTQWDVHAVWSSHCMFSTSAVNHVEYNFRHWEEKKIVTYKLTHLLPLLVLKCRARGHKERSQTHGNRLTDWCRVLGNYRGKAWHSHLMFASYLQVQSGAQRNVWLQSCLLLIVLFLDSWGFILAGPQQLSFSPPVYSLYNFSLTYLFHNNHYMFC